MAPCASTIWSKPKTLTGLALYRPAEEAELAYPATRAHDT